MSILKQQRRKKYVPYREELTNLNQVCAYLCAFCGKSDAVMHFILRNEREKLGGREEER
jgi:uncharacterized protein YcgL (UPF0745 family)